MFRIAAEIPDKPMTFAQWCAWRKEQNERMVGKLMAHLRTLCDDDQWLAETEHAMRAVFDQNLRNELGDDQPRH